MGMYVFFPVVVFGIYHSPWFETIMEKQKVTLYPDHPYAKEIIRKAIRDDRARQQKKLDEEYEAAIKREEEQARR